MCPFEPGKPVAASAMQAIPTVVWLRPVSSAARVEEQIDVVWNCVYRNPPSHNRWIVGISIGPPNGSSAPMPMSSHTRKRTLGEPFGALGSSYGVQSGLESRMSRLIDPLNLLMTPPTQGREREKKR